jgi:prepilin-type N-terminal cleavage/methylation domain-containing protein
MLKNKKSGFTLVELLVVIAIIGLLSTIAVVSLSSARGKARDTKRIADVKQITTSLEQYYNDNNGYPVGNTSTAGNPITLGSSSYNELSSTGFGSSATAPTYMGLIPAYPSPYANSAITGLTQTCASTYTLIATPANQIYANYCYYTSTATGNQTDYRLSFTLESSNSSLGGDQCYTTPSGTSCS